MSHPDPCVKFDEVLLCYDPKERGPVKSSNEIWDLTHGPVIIVQVVATIAFPQKYRYFTRYLVQDMEDYYRPFFDKYMYEMETPQPDESTKDAFVCVEFVINKFEGTTWESYVASNALCAYGTFYDVLRKD